MVTLTNSHAITRAPAEGSRQRDVDPKFSSFQIEPSAALVGEAAVLSPRYLRNRCTSAARLLVGLAVALCSLPPLVRLTSVVHGSESHALIESTPCCGEITPSTDSTNSQNSPEPRPLLWTDQTDYAPGSTAVISGAGFFPGETISVLVLHADGTPPGGHGHLTWDVVADAKGGFQTEWHVDEDDSRGSTLRASATGLSSGLGAHVLFTDASQHFVYLRSVLGAPWQVTTNEAAMNRVFGTAGWLDLRYETVNASNMLANAKFVYMEGGDSNADAMEAFLAANSTAIQAWVNAGGNLFLNAAPNVGNGMSFGFDVELTYPDFIDTGAVTNAAHPIFTGPFSPVGRSWSGSSLAHASVSGPGVFPLITNSSNDRVVLGEKTHGSGRVLFGGLTPDYFHWPEAEAANLRANILHYSAYLSNFDVSKNLPPSFDTITDQTVRLTETAAPRVQAIRFEWLATCGNDPITFYLNGVQASPALNSNYSGSCTCSPGVASYTTVAPATLAAFQIEAPNVVRLSKTGSGTAFAWARITVMWSNGDEITKPIFDLNGGSANQLNLCDATYGFESFEQSATYTASALAPDVRPFITISGITAGELWQYAELSAFSSAANIVSDLEIIGDGSTRILRFSPVGPGIATITVTADDGWQQNNSLTRTFKITVIGSNQAPTANADSVSVRAGSRGETVDVLTNDTDPDGDTLFVSAATHGSKGSVAVTENGTSVVYTPDAGAIGTDSFTYTISDQKGGTASASVSVNIYKRTAMVTLSNLSHTFDAAPKTATASTDAPGTSNFTMTYNGSASAPMNAGSYAVVATLDNLAYQGTATGTLVIAKANPTVVWKNPADIAYGTALDATQLNAVADVAGTFAYTPAEGTMLLAGAHTLHAVFTPEDSDNYATNVSSVEINVIPWAWSGFFQPVHNLPAVNRVKAGRAIPVKFSLGGYKGLSIFVTGSPASVQISDSGTANNHVEGTIDRAGSGSLSYDVTTDQYIYVWKTRAEWADTRRQLRVRLADGTVHVADFKFVK